MLRLCRAAVLVPCAVLVLQAVAADNVLNPDKPAESPKVRASLLQGESMVGKLTAVEGEGDEKTYVLEVGYKQKGVNKQIEAKMAELYKAGIAAAQAKNNAQAQDLKKQYDALAPKLYEMQEVPYEFALKSDKSLIVRRSTLPPKEGEDGKPGKYTAEEKAKLKGDDPKLPGYTADVKDLDKDILVRVYIDKTKIKPPAPKDKKKKDDDTPDEIPTYHVKMFVILPAPETTLGGDPKDPKAAPELKEDPKFRAKVLEGQSFDGKLVKADVEDEMGLIVEVVQKVKVVNAEQQKKYGELQAQLAQTKDANAARNIAQQMKDVAAKYYDTKEVPYQFQLATVPKELKVRLQKLPPKEGADGKPGRYTQEELKQLKGDDPKLPGYTAEAKDLAQDVWVKVFIDKTKYKPAPKPKPGEEASDEPVAYPVHMIMILPTPEEKPGTLPGK